MSVNQSRGDKNEPAQYRRSGRSGNSTLQRNFSGGGGGGKGGGGGSTTAPPSSSSYTSSRSFKVANSAQAVQPRVSSPNTNVNSNSSNFSTTAQNGPHLQPPLRGAPDANVKSSDVLSQKSNPGLPKAPQGNAITPAKGPGDASKGFPLQFGSISPGLMNGMQIPARTSSAPPNFDEQKQAQARLDSLKATTFQTPNVPKQQLPSKDAGGAVVDHSNVIPKAKKNVQPLAAMATTQTQKPSGHPIPMQQMPFHQPQLHVQFGGSNPQIQSQAMANSPLQMPLQLPLPHPPQVQQQVFVQHHPMQSQGIIHQGQNLSFSSQMGPPQLPPQMANMGIGLGPQYPQQQTAKFGGPRKTVKITHPDTHEELRLDKRTEAHPHGPPSFPPMNYYSGSYNANPIFYPPPNSNPMTSAQITSGSQAPPRFYNQVTVKPAASAQRDHETIAGSSLRQSNSNSMPMASSPAPVKDSTPLVNSGAEVAKMATVDKSGSIKEEQKKEGKKVQTIPLDQVGAHHISSDSGASETSKSSSPSIGTNEGVSETSKKEMPAPVAVSISSISALKSGNFEEGLTSTQKIVTVTNSDSSLKVEGPKAEIVGSKEQGAITTVSNETQSMDIDALNAETSAINLSSSLGDKISSSDDSVSRFDSKNADNTDNKESVLLDQESPPVSVSVPEALPSSPSSASSMDKTLLETGKAKGNAAAKAKKKKKEILKNADAQGSTSDLYMAYKVPEEKKEAETTESSSGIMQKQTSIDSSERALESDEKGGHGHSKFEPDDWEDAADISAPKLETLENGEEGNDGMTKKYSRDFLLKFSEQCIDLPEGFEVTSDIAEALIASNVNVSHESYPSPGRSVDRSAAGARLDRRLSNVGDDDKWSKVPGPLGNMRVEIGYHGNVAGFRPGHGGNYGVLRNPRAQSPVAYGGGILSGPMQSPGPQGINIRNNSDSDRWQRASGYQKGLIPSPHAPMPVMHKAERKYEVGKITDEEQAKQRVLKGILNKLTPQNFEKLFEQVKQVNIDNARTLSGVIGQIFDKALMEPTFCEMYANFCSRLAVELPDFTEDDEKITFKRLLLNKCQEEFERGEREQEEANRTDEEGDIKQTEEEREEKRVQARRRMLGNIRLIGELYKKKMLTERIMHECIKKLLGQYQNPDEEDIEALCKLMSTIGEMIDHAKAKEHMDVYFDMMLKLSNNMKLSSRVRFMLKDAIDLRKNKWQQRRKVEGPKKIDEVHRDAAQERHAQSSRLNRGPNVNSSVRRGQGQPIDFGPRGSNLLPSPNAHMSNFRGLPQQLRGYGNQDSRFEERHSFENRTLSVPLRPTGDDSITLGPQGGLARGMSMRGQPLMQSMPLPVAAGPNGYGSMSERTAYGPRYIPERFAPPPAYRVLPSSPPAREPVPMASQNVSSDKVWPEERLRNMSMEAIKEYYSARDEKEVSLCIKDLNAPSFYPSMISIWVTDSFERKDMERDSLAKLLINLTKSQGGILTQDSLLKGFESVLSTLEDAVNDAPRAAEFLGRMFAGILMENVIPYKEVWRLIYEGGEEQGRLVEIGLAAEVLGVILEIIKSEKGDPFLNEIRTGTNLHVENFRPPNIKKSLRLDKFI